MKYRYSVDDEDIDNSYDFETNWGHDELEYVAEEAAKDFHSNHDGWESSWPLDIFLFSITGDALGGFSVELEHQPSFCASKINAR